MILEDREPLIAFDRGSGALIRMERHSAQWTILLPFLSVIPLSESEGESACRIRNAARVPYPSRGAVPCEGWDTTNLDRHFGGPPTLDVFKDGAPTTLCHLDRSEVKRFLSS